MFAGGPRRDPLGLALVKRQQLLDGIEFSGYKFGYWHSNRTPGRAILPQLRCAIEVLGVRRTYEESTSAAGKSIQYSDFPRQIARYSPQEIK